MRTQQYIRVESIVTKYETLASKSDSVKKKTQLASHFDSLLKEGCSVDISDCWNSLSFTDQLLGYIYQLRAGESALNIYTEYANCYLKGFLSDEEELYLVENFEVFVDYAFEHSNVIGELFGHCGEPVTWSNLVPFLLENSGGNIFIPHSNKGREFVGLNNCKLTVGAGFNEAAIRALACGFPINKYELDTGNDHLWPTIENGTFDAVIVDIKEGAFMDSVVDECFNECCRIVKDRGEVLFCLPKESLLNGNNASLHNVIKRDKFLQEAILLPSGDILLHIVKKAHDSFVMCDASGLSKRSNERMVDVEALRKEVKMAEMPERDASPIIRRFSYDMLAESILLPTYYLKFPESGTPIGDISRICTEYVLSDECRPEERVVTVNHLSSLFAKGKFEVTDLPTLKLDRLRRYYRVEGPAVIIAVSKRDIAIGYMTDYASFLVPHNLYVLKPQKGIDVKYLACKLLSKSLKEQLIALVYDCGLTAKLKADWYKLVLMDLESAKEQKLYVQNILSKDFATQEALLSRQEKNFKNAVHLRKHALSQSISAFDSLFCSLEYCMSEHKGVLKVGDQLSPVSPMTVGEAMSILHTSLESVRTRIAHLTDENDWGKCEAIEPQEFVKTYEEQHKSTLFQFTHLWEDFETNCFNKDIFDKETGKLLFHKGEAIHSAWFPKRALLQVFDNIVSNACEHGFKDKNQNGYTIQTRWYTDALNMFIEISNNGAPLPEDVDVDKLLEFGYSTVLNHGEHAGIGGGEISEIMQRYGGNASVISTPEKKFTITYVLSMPLASLY